MSVHAFIAANRFGFGPRPGDLAHIAPDPMGWALRQLDPSQAQHPAFAGLPTTAEAIRDGIALMQEGKRLKETAGPETQRKKLREGVMALRGNFIEETS